MRGVRGCIFLFVRGAPGEAETGTSSTPRRHTPARRSAFPSVRHFVRMHIAAHLDTRVLPLHVYPVAVAVLQ